MKSGEDFRPVLANLFGMKAEHGETEVGIGLTKVEDGATGGKVDSGNQNPGDPGLTSAPDDLREVLSKLGSIEMAVGINHGEG